MKQAYPDVTFHSIIIRFAVGAGLSRHLSFNFQFFLTVATWREYNLVDKESSPAKCFFAQKYIKFNTWNTTCLGNILRTNAKIRRNRKLIAVPGVWCPFMLHAYGCVFCSVTLVSVYTCVGMPLRFKSIVRVPSSQALPGSLITAHHLCEFLMYLARWLCGSIPKKKMGNTQSLFPLLPGAHLPSGTCASNLSRRTQETASDCRVRRLFFFFSKIFWGACFFFGGDNESTATLAVQKMFPGESNIKFLLFPSVPMTLDVTESTSQNCMNANKIWRSFFGQNSRVVNEVHCQESSRFFW